jgi:hypothetical protein
MYLDTQAHRLVNRSLSEWLRLILRHRGVQAVVVCWIVAYGLVLQLVTGALPFDRPALDKLPLWMQLAAPSITLVEIFGLMLIVFFVTRRRPPIDYSLRVGSRRVVMLETVALVTYAAIGQLGGWALGIWLGYGAFSFHLAGSVFGCSVTPSIGEVWVWAGYNFVTFAVVPYAYFRRRYSNQQLNLRSMNRRNDFLLIVAILIVETVFELSAFDHTVFGLSTRQMVIGAPLAFILYFVGTVLPTMILIYAILLPRYRVLTDSSISAVLLGGLTYTAMHIVEGWSNFATPRNIALSLLFLPLQYFGPGMIKSVLTLRTGNAWVHAIGYHALSPHVLVDTPWIVKIFGIR